MPEKHHDVNHEETADEYGRAEGCFVDHHAAPFDPDYLLSRMRSPSGPVKTPAIIPQAGLRSAKLPHTTFQPDVLEFSEQHLQVLLGSRSPAPLWHPLSTPHSLKLPIEEIALGAEPHADVKAHKEELGKWDGLDLTSIWLPLAPTRAHSEEGLHFGRNHERKRGLLIRELERETIKQTREQQALSLRDVHCSLCFDHVHHRTVIDQPHCFKSQTITPPLSPVSDVEDDFIPNKGVCVIDLTSEPRSPTTLSESRRFLEASDTVQWQTEATHDLVHQPRPFDFAAFPDYGPDADGFRLEMPLLLEDSDEVMPAELPPNPNGLRHNPVDPDVSTAEYPSSNSLDEILEANQQRVRHIVQHESLHTAGCLLRLPVRSMNFDISAPFWSKYLTSAVSQYEFLRNSLQEPFRLPLARSVASEEASLKWNPVPKHMVKFEAEEELEPVGVKIEGLLMISSPHGRAMSQSHSTMACLEVSPQDEEYILHVACDLGHEQPPYTESHFFISSSHSEEHPGDSGRRISTSPSSDCSMMQSQKGGSGDEFPHAGKSAVAKRKRHDLEPLGALVSTGALEATGNMLGAFLELRGHKRLCQSKGNGLREGQLLGEHHRLEMSSQVECSSVPAEASHAIMPAQSPDMTLPDRMACFITSLNLDRGVLKLLESKWPRELLIDRDYDHSLRRTVWSAGSVKPEELKSTLCYEADIALLPNTGLIVTTMTRLLRNSPGPQALESLHQQVEMVCSKYDVVMVFVSESNPAGEYTSPMSASDLAAYTDFARFTTAVGGSCTCTFVPGGTETLSKWILALMCTYTARARAFKEILCSEETPWEMFFRRAGMNVMAAQVLAGTLRDYGQEGLSRFLSMSTQEKVGAFGPLIGKRTLVKVSQALDRRWSFM